MLFMHQRKKTAYKRCTFAIEKTKQIWLYTYIMTTRKAL